MAIRVGVIGTGKIGQDHIRRLTRILSGARVHQHLDIGQGEVDFGAFFATLREMNFDGVATVCVFGWEDRAIESSSFMLKRVTKELVG